MRNADGSEREAEYLIALSDDGYRGVFDGRPYFLPWILTR